MAGIVSNLDAHVNLVLLFPSFAGPIQTNTDSAMRASAWYLACNGAQGVSIPRSRPFVGFSMPNTLRTVHSRRCLTVTFRRDFAQDRRQVCDYLTRGVHWYGG